jgi:hypothetical protein
MLGFNPFCAWSIQPWGFSVGIAASWKQSSRRPDRLRPNVSFTVFCHPDNKTNRLSIAFPDLPEVSTLKDEQGTIDSNPQPARVVFEERGHLIPAQVSSPPNGERASVYGQGQMRCFNPSHSLLRQAGMTPSYSLLEFINTQRTTEFNLDFSADIVAVARG